MLTGLASLSIIIANLVFSNKGFNSQVFFDGYKFEVDKVLIGKDYLRLLSSGFLHVSWGHLAANMISLFLFREILESSLGSINFLVIYFGSLIGGNLLALYIHRNHGDYSAVGASGAISGIVFATIAISPGITLNPFFLPLNIPAWTFGLAFIGYSIYGIKSDKDNIGHEAHLGGALIGMIIALIMKPESFMANYYTILIILIPTVAFIYFIVTNPNALHIENSYFEKHQHYETIDEKFNSKKSKDLEDLDSILDKISNSGIESLSSVEKKRLDDFSNHSKK